MSEHDDVLALLDRAAADTPPLHLDHGAVVGRGRRIARRRRAGGAGMAVGGLALAGVLWLGPGLVGGALLGTHEVSPASGEWQVEEPSPIELPEGLQLVGNVRPLTLSRGEGSSSATFAVDGVEETVAGRTLGEGVEVYEGLRGTMVVWEAGVRGEVWPEPQDSRGWAEVTVAGERLSLWTTDAVAYEPEDVLFFDEDSVRTAEGAEVHTGKLEDGRLGMTAFDIPELDVSGYLTDTDLYEVDTLTVSSVDRPWWRGGGFDVTTVARLPHEAVFAREVLRDGSQVVSASEPRVTEPVGDWSMALFVSEWAGGGPETQDLLHTLEWSQDGETWQELAPDAPRSPVDRTPGEAGPGDEVTILGDTYRVALDRHGWPRLLEEDGSVFLAVSDPEGPPRGDGGGIVMWREQWWSPWSPHNYVYFGVGDVPARELAQDDADRLQDVVTLTGPAGVVTVGAVPAGAG